MSIRFKDRFLPTFGVLLLFTVALHCQTGAVATASGQDTTPAWMTNMALRHQQLIDLNGAGTDPVLRDRLMKDYEVDQKARMSLLEAAKTSGTQPDLGKLQPTDARLTADLKAILAEHGWPTIRLVGYDASVAAITILTHSDDHAWQERLTPMLEQLSADSQIDGSTVALLVDKELVAAGKLQRYGTQFKFAEGHMAMYAVENRDTLDTRRAHALLPPLDVYKQMLASAYGIQASDDVIAAPTPAKP